MLQLQIGSPPQLQQVQLDTGSGKLWFMGPKSVLWNSTGRDVSHVSLLPSNMSNPKYFPDGPVGYNASDSKTSKAVEEYRIGYVSYFTNRAPCKDQIYYFKYINDTAGDKDLSFAGTYWSATWEEFRLNNCSFASGACRPAKFMAKPFPLEDLFCKMLHAAKISGTEWFTPYAGPLLDDVVTSGDEKFNIEFQSVLSQATGAGQGAYNKFAAGNGLVGVDLNSTLIAGMKASTMTVAMQQESVLFDEQPPSEWFADANLTALKRPEKIPNPDNMDSAFSVNFLGMGFETSEGEVLSVSSKDAGVGEFGFFDTGNSAIGLPKPVYEKVKEFTHDFNACCMPADMRLTFTFETKTGGQHKASMPLTHLCSDSPCGRCLDNYTPMVGQLPYWDPGFPFLAYQIAQFDYVGKSASLGQAVVTWNKVTSDSTEGCTSHAPIVAMNIGVILAALLVHRMEAQ